jgi:Nucleotide modification associated domain 2
MTPSEPLLFTYTIPIDDGAAPNPFHGICSLAICKPGIRRTARKGDWIAGLGSKHTHHSGDLSGRLVYAMRVDEVVSLEGYDRRAPVDWPHRIPNAGSADVTERLGDCIYDYSSGMARQRPGVHGRENVKTDLGGRNVLVSRDFYYFGNQAIPLPRDLLPICHQTQGHKSKANAPYFERFLTWLRGLNLTPGHLYGRPEYIIDWAEITACGGCIIRARDDEHDEPRTTEPLHPH